MDSTPDLIFYPIRDLSGHLEAGRVVLTPNYRLARAIKLSWGRSQVESGKRAWHSPQVMSLQQWWQHCYEQVLLRGSELPVLATQAQELELWQHVIERHPRGELLLRPRGAAQQARDAWHKLLSWQQDWRDANTSQEFRFDPDAAIFLQWADQFEAELKARGLAVLQQLLIPVAKSCPTTAIVLAEFDTIPPLDLSALGMQASELDHYNAPGTGSRCFTRDCDSEESEILDAANWVVQQHLENPASRIALVHPQLDKQRFTVERALRRAFDISARHDPGVASASRSMPVNFSAGVALSSCGPVRAALDLLSLPCKETRLPDFVKLLHSRYRYQGELEQEQDLLSRLYRYGRERVSAARLRYEASRASSEGEQGLKLGQVLQELEHSRSLRGTRPCGDWRQVFSAVLEELGWPGHGPLDSLEFQQIEHWFHVLEELNEIDAVAGGLAYAEALQHLRQSCDGTVFQPQTEDAPIQVLGLLEGAGLEFDRVWLCGMGVANWPSPPAPNPFIPSRLQKELGMPRASAERELEIARALVDRYQSRSEVLVASYARMQDDVEQQPSELLRGFTTMPEAQESEILPAEWLQCQRALAREWFADERATPLDGSGSGGISGGSSVIADQSRCPFRAFAIHRLNAQPLPELGIGLNAMERGSLLHDCLYHLWAVLEDRATLAALTEAQRRDAVDVAINTGLESFRTNDEGSLAHSLLEVERRRLQMLLGQWLELELQREDFSVIARERDCELELGPLSLKVRLDRVDRLSDGTELIIDYKSGKSSVGEWLGWRPGSPQLPMYAQLAGAELAALAFAILNRQHMGFQGISSRDIGTGFNPDIAKLTRAKDPQLEDWDALREHWRELLLSLAAEFATGHAKVDPADPNTSCKFCGLEHLCRIL